MKSVVLDLAGGVEEQNNLWLQRKQCNAVRVDLQSEPHVYSTLVWGLMLGLIQSSPAHRQLEHVRCTQFVSSKLNPFHVL